MVISRKCYFSLGLPSKKSSYGTGANFIYDVFIEGEKDPDTGLIVNLTDVEVLLKELLFVVDHKHLAFDFKDKISDISIESLHKFMHSKLASSLLGIKEDVVLIKTVLSNEQGQSWTCF